MRYCKSCGRELGPGEGRAPASFDWKNPNGLVCDDCYKSNVGVISFIVYLILGSIAGGLTSVPFLFALGFAVRPLGFPTVRCIVWAVAAVGVVLFFICRAKGNRTSGCLFRAFIKTIGFILLWFALGLTYMSLQDGGDLLKQLCRLDDQSAEQAAAEK